MSDEVREGQFHRNAGKWREMYVVRNPDDNTFDIYRYLADCTMITNRMLVCLCIRASDSQSCFIVRAAFTQNSRVCSPEELEANLKKIDPSKVKQVPQRVGLIR